MDECITDHSGRIQHFAHVVQRHLDNVAQAKVEVNETLASLVLTD